MAEKARIKPLDLGTKYSSKTKNQKMGFLLIESVIGVMILSIMIAAILSVIVAKSERLRSMNEKIQSVMVAADASLEYKISSQFKDTYKDFAGIFNKKVETNGQTYKLSIKVNKEYLVTYGFND